MGRSPSAVPTPPYCILWMQTFGMVRTVKVPEGQAIWLMKHYGWNMLIRDSDMPPSPYDDPPADPAQSNPHRHPDDWGND